MEMTVEALGLVILVGEPGLYGLDQSGITD